MANKDLRSLFERSRNDLLGQIYEQTSAMIYWNFILDGIYSEIIRTINHQ